MTTMRCPKCKHQWHNQPCLMEADCSCKTSRDSDRDPRRRVLRYDIAVGPDELARVPGGDIVHIGVAPNTRPGYVTAWIETWEGDERFPARPMLPTQNLLVYGTGWPINDADKHMGSVITGEFVWHVYQRP